MEKQQEAEKIINTHILWSVGGGLLPLPLVDIAAVTAVQIDMLKQLANLYEVDFSLSSGKALVAGLAGSVAAKFGSSFIKGVPGIGWLIGGISMPALSGTTTYAIGQVVLNHLEAGGDLLDFNTDNVKDAYNAALEKGKEVVAELKEKGQASGDDAPIKGEVVDDEIAAEDAEDAPAVAEEENALADDAPVADETMDDQP
ncbi:MAG TPA: DUF697 domain-containing protein [Anaerolineae bacterium]|nr:DUF697 domain-containing protein [Anaerolineae bacterium]